MAFIKIENFVINTTYIAAVRLGEQTATGEEVVALLIAIPPFSIGSSAASTTVQSHEWIEFRGRSASALKDYFSSFNNVTDLLPHPPFPRMITNNSNY